MARRLQRAAVKQVGVGEVVATHAEHRVLLELVQRDAVEVVAVRPEPAGEARPPRFDLAVAGVLEVVPARVDPVARVPDRDQDGHDARERQRGEHDVAGAGHPRPPLELGLCPAPHEGRDEPEDERRGGAEGDRPRRVVERGTEVGGARGVADVDERAEGQRGQPDRGREREQGRPAARGHEHEHERGPRERDHGAPALRQQLQLEQHHRRRQREAPGPAGRGAPGREVEGGPEADQPEVGGGVQIAGGLRQAAAQEQVGRVVAHDPAERGCPPLSAPCRSRPGRPRPPHRCRDSTAGASPAAEPGRRGRSGSRPVHALPWRVRPGDGRERQHREEPVGAQPHDQAPRGQARRRRGDDDDRRGAPARRARRGTTPSPGTLRRRRRAAARRPRRSGRGGRATSCRCLAIGERGEDHERGILSPPGGYRAALPAARSDTPPG